MFDSFDPQPSAADSIVPSAELFCAVHGSDLLMAAELLGGPKAARRLLNFLSRLQNRVSWEKQIRKELCRIRSLLALECVDDLESEEASCFAMIDPASDVVSDLCILHDQLDELLETTDDDIGVMHS